MLGLDDNDDALDELEMTPVPLSTIDQQPVVLEPALAAVKDLPPFGIRSHPIELSEIMNGIVGGDLLLTGDLPPPNSTGDHQPDIDYGFESIAKMTALDGNESTESAMLKQVGTVDDNEGESVCTSAERRRIDRTSFADVSKHAIDQLEKAKEIFLSCLTYGDFSSGALLAEIVQFHLVPRCRRMFNHFVRGHGCIPLNRQLTEKQSGSSHRKSLPWYSSALFTLEAQVAFINQLSIDNSPFPARYPGIEQLLKTDLPDDFKRRHMSLLRQACIPVSDVGKKRKIGEDQPDAFTASFLGEHLIHREDQVPAANEHIAELKKPKTKKKSGEKKKDAPTFVDDFNVSNEPFGVVFAQQQNKAVSQFDLLQMMKAESMPGVNNSFVSYDTGKVKPLKGLAMRDDPTLTVAQFPEHQRIPSVMLDMKYPHHEIMYQPHMPAPFLYRQKPMTQCDSLVPSARSSLQKMRSFPYEPVGPSPIFNPPGPLFKDALESDPVLPNSLEPVDSLTIPAFDNPVSFPPMQPRQPHPQPHRGSPHRHQHRHHNHHRHHHTSHSNVPSNFTQYQAHVGDDTLTLGSDPHALF